MFTIIAYQLYKSGHILKDDIFPAMVVDLFNVAALYIYFHG